MERYMVDVEEVKQELNGQITLKFGLSRSIMNSSDWLNMERNGDSRQSICSKRMVPNNDEPERIRPWGGDN